MSGPAPPRPRTSWTAILAAVLTLPGFWVIASLLSARMATRAADCTFTGQGFLRAQCPATPLGALASAMHETVNFTVYFAFVGIGLVPPLYTIGYVLTLGSGLIGMWIEGRRTLGPKTRVKGLAVILALFVVVWIARAASIG